MVYPKKINLFPQIDKVNFTIVLLPILPLLITITAQITNCAHELKLIKNKAAVQIFIFRTT